MKKTLLLTLLALLGMPQVVAQEYEYVPFVREGVKWVYYIRDNGITETNWFTQPALGDHKTYRTLELKGDTVINGKTYKAMHMCVDDVDSEPNDVVPIYLREEDKVVYGIIPDGTLYYDCPVYNRYTDMLGMDFYNGEEFVLYDFKDHVGYWDSIFSSPFYQEYPGGYQVNYHLLHTDTITVGNHMAKRYVGELDGHEHITIEGIGWLAHNSNTFTLSLRLPLGNGWFARCFFNSHVMEDGEIAYPQGFVDDRYLPVIREGVQWINERVTVNDGDTTCCYYAYEFNGNHPEKDGNVVYKALYSKDYGKNGVDETEDAKLVAGVREMMSTVSSFKNEALNSVIDQDRNIINFTSFLGGGNHDLSLYYMGEETPQDIIDYYIHNQREPLLTTENFVKADPIVIDGVICSRCAYIGEQGDTLAYVVEGIGFDSYDLGDLLTPFTRKPAPDAEPQEWCGLSHVIKNGQIIYKGMRYRDGATDGIDEVVTDMTNRVLDPNYYNLMGQPVGKDVPTVPGIYIHQGKKIVVR